MSPRFAPVLFGFVLSALMSFLVSGIAIFRNAGPVDGFLGLWISAWLPAWMIAFPVVLVVAPIARHPRGLGWRYFATVGLKNKLLDPERKSNALANGGSFIFRVNDL
jgi:Protein of unknown function (DUF2798)